MKKASTKAPVSKGQVEQLEKREAPSKVTKKVDLKKEQFEPDSMSESSQDEEIVMPVKKEVPAQKTSAVAQKAKQQSSRPSEVAQTDKRIKATTQTHEAQEKPKNQGKEAFELYVQGIDFMATEKDVECHFSGLKDFKSIRLLKREDGRHTGKCFVQFYTDEGRMAGLDLQLSQINGREIYVTLPRPSGERPVNPPGYRANFNPNDGVGTESCSIIVRNLPFSADENSLSTHFSNCGPIDRVRIIRKDDGTSKGFGFVDFKDLESARKALLKTGSKIDSRNIDIQYSIQREQRGDKPSANRPFNQNRPAFGNSRPGFNDAKRGIIADTAMAAEDLDD